MRIELDSDLAGRLALAARTLGRTAEDCARSAIQTFVEDCEEAARNRAQLGVAEGWMPPAIDWTD
jgi:predicted transcriptional regulator